MKSFLGILGAVASIAGLITVAVDSIRNNQNDYDSNESEPEYIPYTDDSNSSANELEDGYMTCERCGSLMKYAKDGYHQICIYCGYSYEP